MTRLSRTDPDDCAICGHPPASHTTTKSGTTLLGCTAAHCKCSQYRKRTPASIRASQTGTGALRPQRGGLPGPADGRLDPRPGAYSRNEPRAFKGVIYDKEPDVPSSDSISGIPLGQYAGANRYDTDTEHVLSLWADGKTFDVRVPLDAASSPASAPAWDLPDDETVWKTYLAQRCNYCGEIGGCANWCSSWESRPPMQPCPAAEHTIGRPIACERETGHQGPHTYWAGPTLIPVEFEDEAPSSAALTTAQDAPAPTPTEEATP